MCFIHRFKPNLRAISRAVRSFLTSNGCTNIQNICFIQLFSVSQRDIPFMDYCSSNGAMQLLNIVKTDSYTNHQDDDPKPFSASPRRSTKETVDAPFIHTICLPSVLWVYSNHHYKVCCVCACALFFCTSWAQLDSEGFRK